MGRLVSFLVSFSYVRLGSPGHSRPCHRRSQTTTHGEHGPTDLESVLGATLQEFESLILRHPDQGERLRRRTATGANAARPSRFRPYFSSATGADQHISGALLDGEGAATEVWQHVFLGITVCV